MPPLHPLPPEWVVTFAALNGVESVGFLLTVALTYRYFEDKAEAALETEYESCCTTFCPFRWPNA